jgi:hypothetical protein
LERLSPRNLIARTDTKIGCILVITDAIPAGDPWAMASQTPPRYRVCKAIPITSDDKKSLFESFRDCPNAKVNSAKIPAAIKSLTARKKMTSELLKAYFATTKPELQITTNIQGA